MRGERMLARGRRMAESRASEIVTVGTFRDATNPDTGDDIRIPVTTRYIGPARIRWNSKEVTNAVAPSMHVAVQEPYLSVPVGTARLFPQDEVVVTDSIDTLLVGRRFRVQGAAAAGQVTAYRYPLEELS